MLRYPTKLYVMLNERHDLEDYALLHIPRILAGLILSTLIGGAAYWRGSLTRSGWFGAIVTGTLTFGFGGWTWGLTLIAFFLSSSGLSHFRQASKQAIAGEKFEKSGRRDLAQTLANGAIGAALALAYGLSGEPIALLAAFAGVMATVTADTWATEIGVLSPRPPRLITSWRSVEPGTSGGITAYGMLASSAGALMIGCLATLLAAIELGDWRPWLPAAALLGGLAGSLADSLLGATIQAIYQAPGGGQTERRAARDGTPNPPLRGWRWVNNDMVNLLSSVVGGLIAVGVLLLIRD
jgi:uncharacterized protein (TIGR00297 family)